MSSGTGCDTRRQEGGEDPSRFGISKKEKVDAVTSVIRYLDGQIDTIAKSSYPRINTRKAW